MRRSRRLRNAGQVGLAQHTAYAGPPGEELRWLDGDVFRVDRIAQTLAPEGVERWAKRHKFYEGLDGLRKNLDEIARTHFRQA